MVLEMLPLTKDDICLVNFSRNKDARNPRDVFI